MFDKDKLPQLKKMRENYIQTLKKLISIEEEIEKAVFYLKSLNKSEQEKVYSIYENYLNGLNDLRRELTCLMKDNMMTLDSFWKKINVENQSTAYKVLTESYHNFMDFVLKCYNPFYWLILPGEDKKGEQ